MRGEVFKYYSIYQGRAILSLYKSSVKHVLLPEAIALHNNTSLCNSLRMAPPTRLSRKPASGSKTPEPTPTLISDEEPPTISEGAPLTLEQRIAAAEKRRDELQALRRLRQIEAEIAQLEDLERGTSPTTPATETPEVQVTGARKRSAPEALAPPYARRTIRIKDPPAYRGKNLKEHREFIRSCEIAFRVLPQEFLRDNEKVIWAMQYLEGDPRELWYTHYERTLNTREEPVTWAYFRQYLLDLLSDPINRGLEAATSHAQAMQRKDQSVRAFATYLEVLEEQLTPYTEEQRVQHLFAKLRPELQRAITNYHQVPATREDLIALGSTLERNLRRSAPAPEQRTKDTYRGKSKDPSPKSKPSSAPTRPKDKSNITCYKCNKTGHYANECTDKSNPNHIPVRVNQVGKGPASPRIREL